MNYLDHPWNQWVIGTGGKDVAVTPNMPGACFFSSCSNWMEVSWNGGHFQIIQVMKPFYYYTLWWLGVHLFREPPNFIDTSTQHQSIPSSHALHSNSPRWILVLLPFYFMVLHFCCWKQCFFLVGYMRHLFFLWIWSFCLRPRCVRAITVLVKTKMLVKCQRNGVLKFALKSAHIGQPCNVGAQWRRCICTPRP